MDKFDQAILEKLSENARQPIASIGDAIGLSRTAVNDRIRKLEQNGIIARYTIDRGDQPAAAICAYFELTFRPFLPEQVKKAIRNIPAIKQAHALSGTTDLMVYVEVLTMEQLNQVRQQLSALEHLEKLVTSMAMERYL